MSLHPTARAREKILLAGSYGSGKSYARNNLISALHSSGSDAKVYLLDTDDTIDRMYDALGEEVCANVEPFYVGGNFDAWKAAADQLAPKVTRDDWVVVDRVDRLWPAAQDYYIQRVFGMDSDEFYLTYAAEIENFNKSAADKDKKQGGSPLAGAYGQRWDHIKRSYANVISQLVMPRSETASGKVYGHAGHVLAMADVKPINESNDSALIQQWFRKFNIRPAGPTNEFNLPAQFHSVLLMYPGPPKWQITTAREREGREYVEGVAWSSFVLNYLMAVGRWEM